MMFLKDNSTMFLYKHSKYHAETKTVEFVNSVDLHEVAQHEPPALDLHCLPLI